MSLLRIGVRLKLVPFDTAARLHFKKYMRNWPKLPPSGYGQKKLYKLVFDRRPITRTYADRIAARAYVSQKLPQLTLPKALVVTTSPKQAVEVLARQASVMKATHGSGMTVLHRPGTILDTVDAHAKATRWLRCDYALINWEWQYHNIPRRLIVEEFLGTESSPPYDYKFAVINGKVRLITVDIGRFDTHTRNVFFPDWTPANTKIGPEPVLVPPPPPPSKLQEMIRYAERLADETDFLRVDLYQVGEEVVFGELTHSPAGGEDDMSNRALDQALGEEWIMPCYHQH